MYTVLARKWRPQVFEDLVAQQTVTRTLQNALSSGRIAHAFLFSGPRGTGKTTCARILAKALNCNAGSGPAVIPCNVCASCTDIAASRSLDVLEIDGASNRGIDEVRELRESAKYQPIRDRFRIFIIDEVHMLTTEAFNALLKILEEPPAHVFFIFATTEFRKVPATIVSRCQLFDFKKIPDRALIDRLAQITREENIVVSEKSLAMIAAASEGGLRDALGTLDQLIAFSGTKIEEKDVETILGLVDLDVMMELADAIATADSAKVIAILDRISEYGIDYKIFYNELLSFYRDLFLLRFAGYRGSAGSDAVNERLRELASKYDETQLLRICQQLVSIQNLLKQSGNLRFVFEITLVKLANVKRLVTLDEIAEGLKKNDNVGVPRFSSSPIVEPAGTPRTLSATRPSQAAATEATPAQTRPPNSKGGIEVTDEFFALLIGQLELQNPRLAAVLEHSKYQKVDSMVKFYIGEGYFRNMIKDEGKVRQELEILLQQKLGGAVQVQILKGEPPPEQQATQISTPETLVSSDPVVQEFLKTFKAKIGKINLNKERQV